MLHGRWLERTEPKLIHFKWDSRVNRHSQKLNGSLRISEILPKPYRYFPFPVEDCLDELVTKCNDQLSKSNAGPTLILTIDKFLDCAKQHKKRCGSHCWVLRGIDEIEAVKKSGNIVKDSATASGFAFSVSSARIIIEQAIRVGDGINIFHERHRRRCPYLPGWQSPDLPCPSGIPGEFDGEALEYYRSFGDEGYGTDNGNSDVERNWLVLDVVWQESCPTQ